MTPLRALPALPGVPAPARRPAPLPVHFSPGGRSVFSGLILALILLALLLQASFFVGLAHGRVGGPDASRPPAAVRAR